MSDRAASELRKDPTKGRWVLIRAADGVPPAAACPLCPGNEDPAAPEIAVYRRDATAGEVPWSVRALPELDPHFQIERDLDREGVGVYDRIGARGATEVIVESPHHRDTPATMPDAQWERVLWMYRDRLRDLKRDVMIRDILITRQHRMPGARTEHPHSRVIAIPIIFDTMRRRLREAREYFQYKRRCVTCDIVRQELAAGERVVHATEDFVALVPYASRVPLETWILPRRHASSYEEALTGGMAVDLARLLGGLFRTLAGGFGDPPFELSLYTSPNERAKLFPGEWATIADDFHWSIEVIPEPGRLSRLGGIYVNDARPERSAARLREAWP